MKAFSDVMVATGRKKQGLSGQMELKQGTLRDLCCLAPVVPGHFRTDGRVQSVQYLLVIFFGAAFCFRFRQLLADKKQHVAY